MVIKRMKIAGLHLRKRISRPVALKSGGEGDQKSGRTEYVHGIPKRSRAEERQIHVRLGRLQPRPHRMSSFE